MAQQNEISAAASTAALAAAPGGAPAAAPGGAPAAAHAAALAAAPGGAPAAALAAALAAAPATDLAAALAAVPAAALAGALAAAPSAALAAAPGGAPAAGNREVPVKIRFYRYKKTILEAVEKAIEDAKKNDQYSIMFELGHGERVEYQRIKEIYTAICNSNKNHRRQDSFNLEDFVKHEMKQDKKYVYGQA